MQSTDVVVLGAGIVGVSAALHLQARGRDVALIDRAGAVGQETSFGNAGLIERSSLIPYLFPRDPAKLIKYALNLLPEAHYHVSAMPAVGPWLLRYWRESAPERVQRNIEARRPLIEHSLSEHEALIQQAGAGELLRRTGWIKLLSQRGDSRRRRSPRRSGCAPMTCISIRSTRPAVAALEPDLAPIAGGVHYRDTASIHRSRRSVESLRRSVRLARRPICSPATRAASRKSRTGAGASTTASGPLVAGAAVVALGPWSDAIYGPLGYRIPLGWKRGYHMHYAAKDGARLNHPILDADVGYLLAPMRRGVRLTSGAEFARRDAPPTPVQIEVCEPTARRLFPLAERLDPEPWRGARPCLPDMLPIVGPAPRHRGLWFDFGHAHHGLTLGPVSGRLLADMMTGEKPFIDPTPYRADRF